MGTVDTVVRTAVRRLSRAKPSRLASKNANIWDPPAQPARPFSADYPGVPNASASGVLERSIDGAPLHATHVVGRRTMHGGDVPLPKEEQLAVANSVAHEIRRGTPAELGRDMGQFVKTRGADGPRREILYAGGLSEAQTQRVISHEAAHAIDSIAGTIPTAGLKKELQGVYNTLNNPNRGRVPGKDLGDAAGWSKPAKPEHFGYDGEKADRELVGEAIRAYMTDPNYLKTVAPKTAAAIREAVNTDARLSKVIQFNSVGAGIGVAAAAAAATLTAGSGEADAAEAKKMADKKSNRSGGMTRRELEAAKANAAAETAKAEADRARADSEARAAEAAAKAETAKVEAAAREKIATEETARNSQRLADAAAKRKAEREARSANLNMAAVATGVTAGVVAGKKVAKAIGAADAAAERLKADQAAKLASVAKGGKGSSGLKAVVKTADKMKLTASESRAGRMGRNAGKLGLPYAAGLAVEAVVSRVVSNKLAADGNVEGAAVANAASMAGTVGAVSLVGQRATDIASPQVMPDARDIHKIEKARIDAGEKPKPSKPRAPKAVAGTVTAALTPANSNAVMAAAKTAAKPSGDAAVKSATATAKSMQKAVSAASAVKSVAGQVVAGAAKVALPALAVTAAVAASAGGASAAESLKAGADVFASGGISAYDEAKARGVGTLEAAAEGVLKGGAAFATMGALPALDDYAKGRGLEGGLVQGLARTYDKIMGAVAGQTVATEDALLAGAKALPAEAGTGNKLIGFQNASTQAAAQAALGAVNLAFAATSDAKVDSVGAASQAVVAAAQAAPPPEIVPKRSMPAADGGAARDFDYAAFDKANSSYEAGRADNREAAGAPESDGRTDDYMRLDPRTGQMVHVTGFTTPTARR